MTTATTKTSAVTLLFFFVLLLLILPPSSSLSFSNYRTLLSLSHSLTLRVANLRASRGDFAGAARAQDIAQKLDSFMGLGFWRLAWTMGLDYFGNYAWADINTVNFDSIASAVSNLNELLRALNELTRVDSEAERVAWIGRNYKNVLAVSKSLFGRLLKMLHQQGPLREVVETIRKEVVEGDFLRDCLELGANDLNGLIQVLKEIAIQYTRSTDKWAEL